MKKRALLLLADGFEEIEAVAPIDILRRAEVDVAVAAVGGTLSVTGKTGITVEADCLLADRRHDAFDALVLPGGPAARSLKENAEVLDLVRTSFSRGLVVGAICAAPTVLREAGVLEGKSYTAHFSVADELPDIRPEAVVTDGTVITSRGAGTAVDFALALVAALRGEEAASAIAAAICRRG
ncbi:MAG: DJ-1 family glyoxalase III [Puniceicoccaceae bacterium]